MTFEYPIKEFKFSHSSRSTFRSCARKLEFPKFYSASKVDKKFDADVGSAVHAAYQKFLETRDEELALVELIANYPTDLFFEKDATPNKSLEACYAALMVMFEHNELESHEISTINCLDGKQRLAIEVPFEIVIKDFNLSNDPNVFIPVSYTGWIDGIMYDWDEHEYVVSDIKTHADNSYDLTAKYKFDEQCLPASLILQEITKEPLDRFKVKYFSVFIDLQKPKTEVYSFMKIEDDVTDWARGLLNDLNQIKSYYNAQWFPRATNGNTCRAWKRDCRYIEECQSRDHEYLAAVFAGDEWSEHRSRNDDWNPWIKLELELG